MSDNQRILAYLHEHGSITTADAWREFSCANPRARISDLRSKGHVIDMVWETGLDRFGERSRWGRWFLKEDANAVVRD